MKHTPLTHPYSRACMRSILLCSGFCLTLQAAELQFSLLPSADNKQLGTAYATVGDIDGDGLTDLAVSDPSYRANGTVLGSGAVYIVSGADGALLRTYQPEAAASQFFGGSLASLDANGDGVIDLAVGSSGYSGSIGYGAGAVRIYSGTDGALLTFTAGTASSQYGSSLANAGDQNADGCDDLYVGAPMASSNRGAVYVQSGLDGSILRTISSPITFASFGVAVAAIGDIDADGLKDLAVTSASAKNGTINAAGKVSLVRSLDGVFAADKFGAAVNNRLGQSLALADDANGDGFPDLLLGSYSGGVALLVSGTDLSTLKDLSIPTLAAFQPVNVGGNVDYDEDGVPDVLIGSPGLNQSVSPAAGGVRILSGVDGSTLFETLATTAYTGLGVSLKVLPDYGFAIGENAVVDATTTGTGAAYLYHIAQEPEIPPVLDTDGDGLLDDVDAVTNSIMDATVSILGLDSGVVNRVDASGTTLADRFATLGLLTDYRRPSQYLVAVTQLTSTLVKQQLLTKKEGARVVAAGAVGIVLNALRR